MSSSSAQPAPSSVLIIGSGVFGMTTAYSLATNPKYAETSITIVDRGEFPQDAASIDVSRLVRSDYSEYDYAKLAISAQDKWRKTWWGKNAYHEPGIVCWAITDDNSPDTNRKAADDLKGSLDNGVKLGLKIGTKANGDDLETLKDIDSVQATYSLTKGCNHSRWSGNVKGGYANWRAGWTNAEQSMRNLREKLNETGRVEFVIGQVSKLIFGKSQSGYDMVMGARLSSGTDLTADLTVLAAGAWSGALIDLRGVASATGHALAYLDISDEEQVALHDNPSLFKKSTGQFIIPPRNNVIRVAQHSFGYSNPTRIPYMEPIDSFASAAKVGGEQFSAHRGNAQPAPSEITVSQPVTSCTQPRLEIPKQAYRDAKACLDEWYPCFADRAKFTRTRMCWYMDTPTGDFLIARHPSYSHIESGSTTRGLFLATGGCGHAFKFLPVIGDKIVQAIEGTLEPELTKLWTWPEKRQSEFLWRPHGRAGRRGLVLADEMAKA